MNSFYPLKVSQIRALTTNAVELKFEIPAELKSKFNFKAGQYITIKHQIGGEEVRRAYSICSSIEEGISVGVKKVETGKMSSFLTTKIKEGDVLQVMPPTGNFVLQGKNVVGICAGSGITPILSMILFTKAIICKFSSGLVQVTLKSILSKAGDLSIANWLSSQLMESVLA